MTVARSTARCGNSSPVEVGPSAPANMAIHTQFVFNVYLEMIFNNDIVGIYFDVVSVTWFGM